MIGSYLLKTFGALTMTYLCLTSPAQATDMGGDFPSEEAMGKKKDIPFEYFDKEHVETAKEIKAMLIKLQDLEEEHEEK